MEKKITQVQLKKVGADSTKIPLDREPVFDPVSKQMKIGDGTTPFNELGYIGSNIEVVDKMPTEAQTGKDNTIFLIPAEESGSGAIAFPVLMADKYNAIFQKDGVLYPMGLSGGSELPFSLNSITIEANTILTEDTTERPLDPNKEYPYYYQIDDPRITDKHTVELVLDVPSQNNSEFGFIGTTYNGYVRLWFSNATLTEQLNILRMTFTKVG